MIYLYLKKHKTANKFYLGKTEQDPMKYQGSGLYWQRLLKKHGNDVETVVLRECENNEEVREWGMYYSKLWNIVENDLFANLTIEYGSGGPVWEGRNHSEESKKKMSLLAQQRGNNRGSGWTHNTETREKIRKAFAGKPRSEETKQKMRKPRLKASCIKCEREVAINRLTRHNCVEK